MEKLDLVWHGIIGLTLDKVNQLTENIKGVYRLSYRHEDTNIYVFFVGESKDIKKSLIEHLSQDENNLCVKNHINLKECYFKYTSLNEDIQKDLVYKQICKFYQPGCNNNKVIASEDIININVN